MKTIIYTSILLLFTLTTYGQWTDGTGTVYVNPTTTKVGIGTSTPLYPLHVDAGTSSGITSRFLKNFNGTYVSANVESRDCAVSNHSIQGQGSAQMGLMTIRNSTSSSSAKSYSGAGVFTTVLDGYESAGSNTIYVGGTLNRIKGTIYDAGDESIFASVTALDEINLNQTWAGYFDGKAYFSERVGIGTTSPDINYMLSINGKIRAKEVVVETGWADFVFEDDYNLISLAELENFVIENNHLPGIPTEEEVKNNGVSVGEMNSKLLQKVEELTLYVIELNKKIEMLKSKPEIK